VSSIRQRNARLNRALAATFARETGVGWQRVIFASAEECTIASQNALERGNGATASLID
jgi:hypothetical protein